MKINEEQLRVPEMPEPKWANDGLPDYSQFDENKSKRKFVQNETNRYEPDGVPNMPQIHWKLSKDGHTFEPDFSALEDDLEDSEE